MKKIIILSALAAIITLIFAELFSVYHFGSAITLLTTLYLLTIFSILDYILIMSIYVIKKIIKKEKIGFKKIIGLILLFIALLLIGIYFVIINADRLNWYQYSSPFYINVIVRSVEFLLPTLILIFISIKLIKK